MIAGGDVAPVSRAIVARAQARTLGLKRYYTGKPCKHGHDAERQVHNCACMECTRASELLERCWSRLSERRLPGELRPMITRELTRLTMCAAFDAIQKIRQAPDARKKAGRRKMREAFGIDDSELDQFATSLLEWMKRQ